MSLIEIIAPTAEPVSAAEVKAAARIDADSTAFDAPLALLIPALRHHLTELKG